MRAVHVSAPPVASVHPGVVFVRFILTVGTVLAGAGTAIANDALPEAFEAAGIMLEPPLPPRQLARQTTRPNAKKRALMLTLGAYRVRG